MMKVIMPIYDKAESQTKVKENGGFQSNGSILAFLDVQKEIKETNVEVYSLIYHANPYIQNISKQKYALFSFANSPHFIQNNAIFGKFDLG